MSAYDSFYSRCAKCGTKIEIQIKDFDSCGDSYQKGDKIDLREAPDNFEIDDKNGCFYCEYINTIIVKDRIFKGFKKIGE